MTPRLIMNVAGRAIRQLADGSLRWVAGMTIDADGSPRAYHPQAGKGLDHLGNAGRPGSWWGIATDGRGRPLVQGPDDPAPGFYISTTAYEHTGFKAGDPRRYLDSETVPFIVVPGPLRARVAGVVLGCRAVVVRGGKTCEAVVGDIGPATHLGEASIACAAALGIPSDAKRGGCASGVTYTIFPGVAAEGFRLIPA